MTQRSAQAFSDTINGDSEVYLKPQIKLEPLVCRWPAWPHLIAPAQAAMNIAFRYLQNLQSFVTNPSVHIAAARDPELLGGPYICLRQEDVPRVQTLIEETKRQMAPALEFAKSYKDLDSKLQSTASGYCLDDFSRDLPPSLSGLVELTYDLNNHPKIKIFEELLYGSETDVADAQEICLQAARDDDRLFFMSAPLLNEDGRLFIRRKFDDPAVARLGASRTVGQRWSTLQDQLGVAEPDLQMLQTFFTTTPPVRNAPEYRGEGVRVRYFGHACILLQTDEVAVLLDPSTAWERDAHEATLTFADLPDVIDYMIITHCHQDHLIPEMLVQLASRVQRVLIPGNDRGNLVDPSVKLILRQLGYRDVVVLDPMGSVAIPGGEIVGLPFTGEHAGLEVNSKQCVAVKLKGRSLLFLVDSDAIDVGLYRRIGRWIGKVDAVFFGMECHGAPLSWLYGPLLTRPISRRDDDSRRLSACDAERGWALLQQFDCKRAFIYAMGQEPWMKHIMGLEYKPDSVQLTECDKFITRCNNHGLAAVRLRGCTQILL